MDGMKRMKKYNVLLIGCGSQGVFSDAPGTGNENKVISFAKALSLYPDYFNVYVLDQNRVKMALTNRLYGFKYHDCDVNYDIVIVTTPDNTHYKILLDIPLKYPSAKLVVCEKPMCMTSKETKEIIQIYEQHNISVLVNYTRRFIPELIALKEHGLAIGGTCVFNRGWEHTATHAIDFFNMLGCKGVYVENTDAINRMWYVSVLFEDCYLFNEYRYGNMPVLEYYDLHMQYVIQNLIGYLNGTEDLKCTMYDAMKCISKMEELKNGIL